MADLPPTHAERIELNSKIIQEAMTRDPKKYSLIKPLSSLTYDDWGNFTTLVIGNLRVSDFELRPYLSHCNHIFSAFAVSTAQSIYKKEEDGLIQVGHSWTATLILGFVIGSIQHAVCGNQHISTFAVKYAGNVKQLEKMAARNSGAIVLGVTGKPPCGKKPGFFSTIF